MQWQVYRIIFRLIKTALNNKDCYLILSSLVSSLRKERKMQFTILFRI